LPRQKGVEPLIVGGEVENVYVRFFHDPCAKSLRFTVTNTAPTKLLGPHAYCDMPRPDDASSIVAHGWGFYTEWTAFRSAQMISQTNAYRMLLCVASRLSSKLIFSS
jgi:hypothetical protein